MQLDLESTESQTRRTAVSDRGTEAQCESHINCTLEILLLKMSNVIGNYYETKRMINEGVINLDVRIWRPWAISGSLKSLVG